MLEHYPRNWYDTQVQSALRLSHRKVLHANVGLHSQQVLTVEHSDFSGAAGTVPSYFTPLCHSILIGQTIGLSGPYFSLNPSFSRGVVTDITADVSSVLGRPNKLLMRRFSHNF